jgi:hypothetical protein
MRDLHDRPDLRIIEALREPHSKIHTRSLPDFPGDRKHELPMLDAFSSDQPVGDHLDVLGFSPQQKHLQAKMMAKVNMYSRDDCVQVLMLVMGEFFLQFPLMMVVNECERADALCILLPQLVFYQ